MSKRPSDYRRRAPRRKPNNAILLVCGGHTEKIYFEQFNLDLAKIRVVANLHARNPRSIVERAIREKASNQYNQVWCLFDKDIFTCFDEAILLARANDIKVASSNQAFDLWYVLHFQRQDGPLHREKYSEIIKRGLNRPYSKTDASIYNALRPKMRNAIENAKAGHQCHKRAGNRPGECESFTTVYLLVEHLLKWSTTP